MVELTQELLLSLFSYRDGNLFWKLRKANNMHIGDKAGSFNKLNGYHQTLINSKSYRTHRLIFLYHYGYLPKQIDHIDQNPTNNRIENLQDISKQNNLRKQKATLTFNDKPTSSKYKGVTRYNLTKQWRSRIWVDGKSKHLGYFVSEIDAARAYNNAATELFGEFACLNIITPKCL